MASMSLFFLMLCIPTLAAANDQIDVRGIPPNPFFRRASNNIPPEGYFNPMSNGGSMLTSVPGTFPAGQGEPINAIITANSDSDVLKDQEIDGGLRNYFLSFGFSSECLGQHAGSDQAANLGDGNGYLNETAVIRWDYGDPELGSCKETVEGGDHFRYWVQNGKDANSGAIFMAVSYELPIKLQHDIIPNGYDFGRDWLIANATASSSLIPTFQLQANATISGQTSFGNYTYHTDVVYIPGLLPNTSIGINHNLTVPINGSSAVDGLVAVMTVKIVSRPPSFALRLSPPLSFVAFSSIMALAASVLPLLS